MQTQKTNNNIKTIYCQKLQQELPALQAMPYPGAIGEKILKNISQPAWELWLNHQTMLINENRLSLLDPKARKFLLEQMQAFLFNQGELQKPQGYTPVTNKKSVKK